MALKRYTQADLDQILGRIRSKATFKIRFLLPLLGTQPATDKGLEAYIEHHLGIDPLRDNITGKPTNSDFNNTFERIKNEEIGERDLTPEAGEVEEKKVYGINVVRKSAAGPFLLAHMVKAALKQAASRCGFFEKKKGSKGDMAEIGEVVAEGESLQAKDRPWEIYLRKDGKPAKTYFETERGTVSTPSGKKSIQYEAEHVEEGATAEFSFHWPARKLTEEDMAQVAALVTAAALGGARSLSHGKFEVLSLTIEGPAS